MITTYYRAELKGGRRWQLYNSYFNNIHFLIIFGIEINRQININAIKGQFLKQTEVNKPMFRHSPFHANSNSITIYYQLLA